MLGTHYVGSAQDESSAVSVGEARKALGFAVEVAPWAGMGGKPWRGPLLRIGLHIRIVYKCTI